LGLSTMRERAQLSMGSFDIESTIGKGNPHSCFMVEDCHQRERIFNSIACVTSTMFSEDYPSMQCPKS
ncbi:MAG TPA: hypothetical protein VLW47_11300, partial [Thermodesulfobacteriota bacterium]|nr:hypothetical protein [Thermodesulfobacteriota bacterium]